MIRQCHICGDCGEGYRLTPLGAECHSCAGELAQFDADELGLNPETDNDPNHQERGA